MITMHATTNAVTSSSWTYFMRFFIKRKKVKTSITGTINIDFDSLLFSSGWTEARIVDIKIMIVFELITCDKEQNHLTAFCVIPDVKSS